MVVEARIGEERNMKGEREILLDRAVKDPVLFGRELTWTPVLDHVWTRLNH